MKRSASHLVVMGTALMFSLTATTACMPLFPPPDPPEPLLTRPEVRSIVKCQDKIATSGKTLVQVQTAAVEECALDILHLRLLYENELISEDRYNEWLDDIRRDCDKKLRRVTKASRNFMDDVIRVCDPVGDLILDDYDSLRFQLLEDEFEGSVDTSSIPLLAGSICAIKSLLVNMMIAAQIPRTLELFSYLGEDYITIFGGDPTEFGTLVLPLDERCLEADIFSEFPEA